MIRRPPRSTLSSSSAASDVYKRQRRYVHTYDLGGAQSVQRLHREKGVHQLGDVRTQIAGSGSAPDRVPGEERDLLRRVVGFIGAVAPLRLGPGLDQLASTCTATVVSVTLVSVLAPTWVHGTEYSTLSTTMWQSGATFAGQPAGQLDRPGRQPQQRRRLERGEHRQRAGAF